LPIEGILGRSVKRRTLILAGGAIAMTGGAMLILRALTPDPAERARKIANEQGIIVGYGDPATFYTPPYLPEDARLPRVDMLSAERAAIPPALDGIETSLRQYPPGFVAKLIKAIFIAGRIMIDGAETGGTYGHAWILLAAPMEIGVASIRLTCRLGVHHELSSFVYNRGDTASLWRKTHPGNWQFATSAKVEIERADLPAPSPETGFLSAYGATTPENDFNVYAEKMMTEMPAVVRLTKQVPLIARKAAFVRQRYVEIDPRMDVVFSQMGMLAGSCQRLRNQST
jgi:hypothetical protein